MKKLITTILAAAMIVALVFALGCKKKSTEPDNNGGGGGGDVPPVTNVYLGVIGFNDSIFVKEVSPMDTSWIEDFRSFVRYTYYTEVSKLYYSERTALEIMKSADLPVNPENVTLITLTDGIDYGSLSSEVSNPDGFMTKQEYLNALHDSIQNNSVFGNNINSYTIGYMNESAQANYDEFRNNLDMLASDEGNVYEAYTMDSVANVFKAVADTLHGVVAGNGTVMLVIDLDCSYSFANGGSGQPWPHPTPEPPEPTPPHPIPPISPDPPIDDVIEDVIRIIHHGRWSLPVVETLPVWDVTENSAYCGGNIISNGGTTITRKGVCWYKTPSPNIGHYATYDGIGSESFTSWMSGLDPNTTYYVRAYAENIMGISYGEEYSFTTLGGTGDEATFSIEGHGVIIAPGNLQYHTGTHEWRFAENAWDYIGYDNIYANSASYSGWVDLYCWGTGSTPTSMLDDSQYYLHFTDWGINPISNAGNTPNQWRTLSKAEWESILYNRETPSGIRFAMGQVNGVNGVILVPDQWNSDYYPLTHCNEGGVLGDMPNVISADTWDSALKPHGAVFLPCAGKRKHFDNPATYQEGNVWGAYWTPTEAEDVNGLGSEIIKMAYALIPSIYLGLGQGVELEPYERDYGASVRLVKDVGR